MAGFAVSLFGQTYRMSCWAASMRMILDSRGRKVATDDAIAQPLNYGASLQSGLNPNDTRILRHWGFATEAPQTFTEDGFVRLVNSRGPLWVACDVRFPGASRAAPHVRVVRGVRDQQSPLALMINDPGPVGRGSQYDETYMDFVAKNELLGAGERNEPAPIYVAYLA